MQLRSRRNVQKKQAATRNGWTTNFPGSPEAAAAAMKWRKSCGKGRYLVAVTVCRTVNQTVMSVVNRLAGSVVMMMKEVSNKREFPCQMTYWPEFRKVLRSQKAFLKVRELSWSSRNCLYGSERLSKFRKRLWSSESWGNVLEVQKQTFLWSTGNCLEVQGTFLKFRRGLWSSENFPHFQKTSLKVMKLS